MKTSIVLSAFLLGTTALAQAPPQVTDPGVRTGAAGAGGAIVGLSTAEKQFWGVAKTVFEEVEGVPEGLGPRFNLDSCAGCHKQPEVGGTSPSTNPQVAVAKAMGATNTIPTFITPNGPVREARFIKLPNGQPDGGVHDLFVITGRTDAPPGCAIKQPDFAAELNAHNVIFRIPTPLFGLGFVESLSDLDLEKSFNANTSEKQGMGIHGHFNRNNERHFNTSGNTGNITRFGWKAQNPSLLVFAGEAYNVEMGVTSDNFPNERETDPNCATNPQPETTTNLTDPTPSASPAADFSQDIVNFAAFMRLNAAPTPIPPTADTQIGQQAFGQIGCSHCHTPSFTAGRSVFTGVTGTAFSPYSDFAVHDMGDGLEDNVTQGTATGREFRTAPLWGVGQRIFFLHDGRTSDLVQAIAAHASGGSEANQVINNFKQLPPSVQQSLINFLRSL